MNKVASLSPLLVSLYAPGKLQKTSGFLKFSRGIERDQWHEVEVLKVGKIFLLRSLLAEV